MLSLRQQQKLLQKLSPQQIQLMKLFQVPTFALEQRIKEELENNPALMESGDDTDSDLVDDIDTQENDDEFSLEDYVDHDDIPDYKLHTNNYSADQEDKTMPIAVGVDFYELLFSQLGFRNLDSRKVNIAKHIIGNIDESGYLSRDLDSMVDDLEFLQNISTTTKELEELLEIIQDFDPAGVGARDLQECLLIQIKKKDEESDEVRLAIEVLEKYFNEFTKKHYTKIIQRLSITEDDLRNVIDEILKLNPKPGSSFNDKKSTEYVMPDFIINVNDDDLELVINSKNAPELRLNRKYSEMLETFSSKKGKHTKEEKNAVLFVKQKIDSARWFIDAIKQRQETFFNVISSIMKHQYDFFMTGDETQIKPMILKDIADDVEMDISTVSRVTSNKYVQTPYGTYLLKYLFSESLQTDSGEDASTREIKMILKECIDAEDKKKPITDEKLSEKLKEKGYNVARRTISKYREQLDIPVARLRKEI